MFNKESCRSCGKKLVPFSMCNYCNEHISWICNKCQRVEDVTHKHDRDYESHEDTSLQFRGSIENGIMHFHKAGTPK
jgi:hypothetical protein